jgi:hypothetical protein
MRADNYSSISPQKGFGLCFSYTYRSIRSIRSIGFCPVSSSFPSSLTCPLQGRKKLALEKKRGAEKDLLKKVEGRDILPAEIKDWQYSC